MIEIPYLNPKERERHFGVAWATQYFDDFVTDYIQIHVMAFNENEDAWFLFPITFSKN